MAELVLKTVADAAAALDHATSAIRAGEVAQCLAIARLCDLHEVDETVLVEGCERWVPGGADGTPLIGEFVTAHISTLLGAGIGSAFRSINRVLNLRHRHPTLWRLVIEGDIRPFEGFRVADAAVAAKLDAAACARFDRLCAAALRLQPWGRVRSQVEHHEQVGVDDGVEVGIHGPDQPRQGRLAVRAPRMALRHRRDPILRAAGRACHHVRHDASVSD